MGARSAFWTTWPTSPPVRWSGGSGTPASQLADNLPSRLPSRGPVRSEQALVRAVGAAAAGGRAGSGRGGRTAAVLRPEGRAPVTLAGLAGQEEPGFRVVLSDQTEQEPVWEDPAVAA